MVELIPPWVATALGGPQKAVPSAGPQPMPLEVFIDETLKKLESGADEIAVADSSNLVAAANSEILKTVFARMNR